MKSQNFFILLFFMNYHFSNGFLLTPVKNLKSSDAFKLKVCRSVNSNKHFITVKPLHKSKKYRCKKVSPNKLRKYLNITPQKLKAYYNKNAKNSKRTHKFEIKNSLLYVNILKKYLQNYICYNFYKKFKKHKCETKLTKCKRIFRKNNFQIYSTVDLVKIFKKVAETVQIQKKVKKFRNSILILNVGSKDLELSHFIFDKLQKKFKIFNGFDIILLKTKGRLHLYKFSSKNYRIQLRNLKTNKNYMRNKKKEKIGSYLRRFRRQRNNIKSSHSNSRELIVNDKLKKLNEFSRQCKVYKKVHDYFSSVHNRNYKLVYYFDPLIDIKFGRKYGRVHYLNRLITFQMNSNNKINKLGEIKTKNSNKTFTQYVNSFRKKSKKNLVNSAKISNNKKKKGKKNNTKAKSGKKSLKKIKAKTKKSTGLGNSNSTNLSNLIILPNNGTKIENTKNSYNSRLNQIFLEFDPNNHDHYFDVLNGLQHKDASATTGDRIVYQNTTFNDREDFLTNEIAYKVKPKKSRKISNLNKIKSIKLSQDEQEFYDRKWAKLNEFNRAFSDPVYKD